MKQIAPYTVSEPFPGLYVIDEGGVRCFLIPGETEALLIDSGFGKGDLAAQVREITALPVVLVHTHTDGDHAGCDAQFSRIGLHPAEYDHFVQSLKRSEQADKTLPDRFFPVWEGEKLTFGAYTFEVVLIPGHTPGSIALLDEEHRLLIGGDSIQTGAIYMFGPGRNMPAFLASMRRLDALRGRFDRVLASHDALIVGADLIPELIEGAEAYLRGELTAEEPPFPLPARVYRLNRVKFLC